MNLQHARQRLLDTRTELEGRLERAHKHIRGREEEVSPNFHEQVVETGNDQVVQFLEQEGQQQLQQIDRALQRIDSGDYERCNKCGEAIGEQRLGALPWTEFCINCV
ncbi:MAG: TraR/DksA C4-type zinc finger protein [Gammaproteobacteria bacterium]|nr:TraR/DksA C4-type zinc finger protein [Gammaproteobacteria bacterium]MDP2140567.1 TraR/DksA C4-type zinc finger protein [Gammaproteobacteria bacterium]MDP2347336.1 TraR/DksA C4-type zinc finger protein [Gammaproteobacteria bacterium]